MIARRTASVCYPRPMFETIRAGLGRLRSRGVTHPPPNPVDASTAREVRGELEWFLDAAPERFTRFFLHGRILRASRREAALFRTLEPLGLVTHWISSLWMPCVRLVPFPGRFIATDLLSHREADQVFSPMFEQVYFVRNTLVKPGDEVLEIGVGSGVLGLSCGDIAGAVTGVEINARALAFARFNRDLSPAKGSIDWRLGSLYEPIEPGHRFDLVLSNPPFEPVPDGESRFLHSDAGEDGLDIARAILSGVAPHMKPDGRFAMISWSPGSAQRIALVDLVRNALGTHRIESHLLGSWPIEEHLATFPSGPGRDRWRRSSAARGLTHLHFVFLQTWPAEKPEVETLRPQEEIDACYAIADAWEAPLRRRS